MSADLVPWRVSGGCVCGAVRFDVTIDLPAIQLYDIEELLEVRRAQEEEALGLKPFGACNGIWQLCNRPECLELAKKYDSENRQLGIPTVST
jgi:hypothetical protein